jgi:hypothetical protein
LMPGRLGFVPHPNLPGCIFIFAVFFKLDDITK